MPVRREVRYTFARQPRLVRVACRVVAQRVHAWGARLDEQTGSTLRLLISEIVTNALRHTATPFIRLRLSVADASLLVSVQDDSPILPVVTAPDPEAWESEHGRGLLIVAALADLHGWRRAGRGKCVWFQLALPEAQRAHPPTGRAQQHKAATPTSVCSRAHRPDGPPHARGSSRPAASCRRAPRPRAAQVRSLRCPRPARFWREGRGS
ncbi:ATP-binding protein [Streptacidiphilus neutrinimicus]|uniref:ATP-binding protein n=1 Tax=Streptacidiphilus neutrinimicus TaxID=105420 RepID=UPI000693648D|nr:ATP-binding protein [Streptacidiphilus neutrinimicus]